MRAEPIDVAVRETQAALAGVEDALAGGPLPPSLLPTPLAVVGDALRLGLDLATPIQQWLEQLSKADLERALQTLVGEAVTWSLPDVGEGDSADDASVGFMVRLRDQACSVATAVRRALVPRGPGASEPAELLTLESTLRTFDARLAMLLSRSDLARVLGTREAFGAPWASSFREREAD